MTYKPRLFSVIAVLIIALAVLSFRLSATPPPVARGGATHGRVIISPVAPFLQAGTIRPNIIWSPTTSISVIAPPGASMSTSLTFVSSLALNNAIIEAVPQIAGFLNIQPNAITSLGANQQQPVQITINVPAGTALGTYDGTIHVRVGSATVPQTLKVSVLVTQVPFALSIPANYQPNMQIMSQGGPVLLNNFNSQYDHGGFVPPAGAEITITSIPLPPPPLSNFIFNELQGATISSSGTVVVSGVVCTEVFYTDSFGPNVNYSEVGVYCPSNTTLYKLFLFYRAGDPAESQFQNTFQQILNSIQLTL